MKLTYSQFPVIKALSSSELLSSNNFVGHLSENVESYRKHQLLYDEVFEGFKKDSLTNIEYVTAPVGRAFFGDTGIANKIWNLRNDTPSKTGVLIFQPKMVFCYKVENNILSEHVEIQIIAVSENVVSGIFIAGWEYSSNDKTTFKAGFQSEELKVLPLDLPIRMVVNFLLFKEYAELETIVIDKAVTKKVKVNGEKFITDIPYKIKIIDSTYFTNIIRTEGFKVSGHFRLQPYGPNLKDRKLIWINDFDKKGYSRTATIIKEAP